MAIERRELKNVTDADDCEVFEKALAFQNGKVVMVLYGILRNGDFWGHRQTFNQVNISWSDMFEMTTENLWDVLGQPQVIEIDVRTLPGLKGGN